MTFYGFFILIGVFIAIMLVYRRAGAWIKSLKPKTVKRVNWLGFIVGVIAGVAWFIFKDMTFMIITMAGVVVYFLFYDYDAPPGNERSNP